MESTPYLKLIDEVTISATDGKSVICGQKELFRGSIDGNFRDFGLDQPSDSTPETGVKVFDHIKDGEFNQIFCSFGVSLEVLALTQSQVIEIVKNKRELLSQNGWDSFFLLQAGHEYFVASVFCFSGGDLCILLYRLDSSIVWDGGYGNRVFVRNLQDA